MAAERPAFGISLPDAEHAFHRAYHSAYGDSRADMAVDSLAARLASAKIDKPTSGSEVCGAGARAFIICR